MRRGVSRRALAGRGNAAGSAVGMRLAVGRLLDFADGIYDPSAGSFFGRTPRRWGRCCLCFVVLYTALLGLFASMMALYFIHIVDKDTPRHYLIDSLLQQPGLNYRPRMSSESTLLRFERSNDSHVAELRDAALEFLRPYEPPYQVGDRFKDCQEGSASSTDSDRVCTFKTDWLGDCNYAVDFGYEDGAPCLFMRLNKVFMWVPENYEDDEVPEEIKSVWVKDVITLTCDGADAVSKEFIGDIQYYPIQGWSFKYFPYRKQNGYRSPLVAVHFAEPLARVPIFVECRAWAKNIYQDEEKSIGYVKFELIID